MSWHARGRQAAQRMGLDPRYARRLRWVAKANAVRQAGARVRDTLPFILADPEPDNFTYELTNEEQLVSWVAAVATAEPAAARRALAEPGLDAELRRRLRATATAHWWWSKPEPPFGKRRGWYALTRLLKPSLVIETGVHDGLSSLLLLRALERNASDGAEGRLVSFDVNPAAGWLVGDHPRWELRIESGRAGLPAVLARAKPIGLFVHDSLHTYENERWELRTVAPFLSDRGVLISDNVHVTRALVATCEEFGLRYEEFTERPAGHFYPGGGVGAGSRAACS